MYEATSKNKTKSAIVVIGFFIFVSLAIYYISSAFSYYFGYEPGGFGIAGLALIISGVTSFASYYYSDKIVLSISQAKEADRERYFDFYTVAENLAIATGLPKPKLYIIEDSAPNAFATGRDPDHAVIVATTGLLSKLTRTELEGVIAHEMGHIKNYDVRLMSVVAVLVGSLALLGDLFLRARFRGKRDSKSGSAGTIVLVLGILFALLSPIIAKLIQFAISRRREFLADASSVAITRQPNGLISALQKIANDTEPLEVANKATAHLYIADPFKGKIGDARARFASLFNTHPPVEERIAALSRMT
ncbi:M48 family metallopeptidase [Candidatus Woesebacteria bacterium]|nr:M48 family metallopeptidase [Candidatus Woesebacteria bacterium]